MFFIGIGFSAFSKSFSTNRDGIEPLQKTQNQINGLNLVFPVMREVTAIERERTKSEKK